MYYPCLYNESLLLVSSDSIIILELSTKVSISQFGSKQLLPGPKTAVNVWLVLPGMEGIVCVVNKPLWLFVLILNGIFTGSLDKFVTFSSILYYKNGIVVKNMCRTIKSIVIFDYLLQYTSCKTIKSLYIRII